MLKEDVSKLKTVDIYSLILFVIFQLHKVPEYAVLSELIYTVDKNSLLNLCKQFGGLTITIPTLEELDFVVDALLLYCYVNLEHKSLEEALSLLNIDKNQSKQLYNTYETLLATLKDFDFQR